MSEDGEPVWLTYKELAAQLGCTANAARMHAHRRGWPKRAPNRVDDPARVLVPDGAVVRDRTTHVTVQCDAPPNGVEQLHSAGLVQAIEALSAALAAERARTDSLETALADARTAAMVSSNQVAALRAQLALLSGRPPWWRRWFRG